MGSEHDNAAADKAEHYGGDLRSTEVTKQGFDNEKQADPVVTSSEKSPGANEEEDILKRTESVRSGLDAMGRQAGLDILSNKPHVKRNDGSEIKNSLSIKPNLQAAELCATSVGQMSSRKLNLPHAEGSGLNPLQTISSCISEEQRYIPSSTTKPFVIWMDGHELQNGAESIKPCIAEMERKKSCLSVASLSPNKPHKMDAGWAWLVLFAGTFHHMLSDGVISSLGVFLVAWREQFPQCTVFEISVIISLIFGCAYVAGPFGSALCKTFSIRQVVMGGAILTSVSFTMAAFSSSLWHLYATFTTAGIGLSLTLQPTTVIITYYFDKLLARANGVSYAGVGLGVFIFPPLFQLWINDYGWRGGLLIIAGLVANIGICAALYRSTPLEVKSRKPKKIRVQSEDKTETITHKCSCITASYLYNFLRNFLKSFDLKLLKNFQFDLLLIANIIYGLAYAIAIVYLPARAVQSGIHPLHAAFLLSIIGISSFISRITHGYIIDYHIMTAPVLTASAFFVCGIACTLNPVTDEYSGLIALSALVGLSSGVYNSTVPLMAKDYVGLHKVSGGVGLLHLVTGSGVTLGSFSAGFLVDATGGYDMPFYLAGACFIISSILVFVYPISKYLEHGDEVDEETVMSSAQCKEEGLQGQDNVAMVIE